MISDHLEALLWLAAGTHRYTIASMQQALKMKVFSYKQCFNNAVSWRVATLEQAENVLIVLNVHVLAYSLSRMRRAVTVPTAVRAAACMP